MNMFSIAATSFTSTNQTGGQTNENAVYVGVGATTLSRYFMFKLFQIRRTLIPFIITLFIQVL